MEYDSKSDTLEHIKNVQRFINQIIAELLERAEKHDESKLQEPEKSIFDKFTPKLSNTTYGSDEYKNMLSEMKPAIDHHNSKNRHHPEHHPHGINGMNLIDLIEMFCDWKAATLRHKDGDILRSIEVCNDRFKIDPQLLQVFINTVLYMDW